MNENLRRKLKHYTPEIIVAMTALAGAAAVVYIAKTTQVDVVPNYQLDLPKSVVKHMMETGDVCGIRCDTLHLMVVLTDN